MLKELLAAALEAHPGAVPDLRFLIAASDGLEGREVRDVSLVPFFGPTLQYAVTLPDYSMNGWPEVEGLESLDDLASWAETAVARNPWETRLDKWVWVGNKRTHPSRDKFIRRVEGLKESKPEVGDRLDVYHVEPSDRDRQKPLRELVTYRHCIDLRGRGYSGRVPSLFLMGCLVWMTPRDVTQYWWPLLEEGVHYLALDGTGEDLEDKVRWAGDHEDECRAIAEAGRRRMVEIVLGTNRDRYTASTLLKAWGAGVDLPYCAADDAACLSPRDAPPAWDTWPPLGDRRDGAEGVQ